jgi:2,5-diamino-6-(ribosylamino)-4(3H)-pyrimidinone 5'-phosphate reductase
MSDTPDETVRAVLRPRVICHMATSLDGRIVVDGWPAAADVRREYEQVHASYDADGWMCGRVTMEPFAGALRSDAEVAREYRGGAREDLIAEGQHESFAFAVDPSGRLAWKSNDIDGDHVVAIVSERVSDEYLAMLRERDVSYLIAGKRTLDAPLALERIATRFGVRTLMLEGGGKINGAMLRAGLIDEVSVIMAPVADGRIGTPALFDVGGDKISPMRLVLEKVEARASDIVWLRYRIDTQRPRDAI